MECDNLRRQRQQLIRTLTAVSADIVHTSEAINDVPKPFREEVFLAALRLMQIRVSSTIFQIAQEIEGEKERSTINNFFELLKERRCASSTAIFLRKDYVR